MGQVEKYSTSTHFPQLELKWPPTVLQGTGK